MIKPYCKLFSNEFLATMNVETTLGFAWQQAAVDVEVAAVAISIHRADYSHFGHNVVTTF